MMAAPTKVPTSTDLANYGSLSSDVILALYFDVAPCNDVVLAGTYNNWNTDDVAALTRFEPVTGFDGWYVASFPFEEGAAGKAVQLKNDGTFNWLYQTGDANAWISQGGNAATIEAGYDGECNVSYPKAGAYIYEIAYWKNNNNPCESVAYKYTLILKDPYCEENPEFTPAVAGDHNGWGTSPMSEGTYQGDFAWIISFEAEGGYEFKFLEATQGWANELQQYVDEAWVKFSNIKLPAITKDSTLVFDYSNTEKYRYPMCGVAFYKVKINATLPAGAPDSVELMGSFNGGVWDGKGIVMDLVDGVYTAEVEGTEVSEFKFRSGVGDTDGEKWANQIMQYDSEEWKEAPNFKFEDEWEEGDEEGEYVINLDLSNPAKYSWSKTIPTGIENVVLTEKAQKVVVDGVVYIIRNNKMFNIHGAQVR